MVTLGHWSCKAFSETRTCKSDATEGIAPNHVVDGGALRKLRRASAPFEPQTLLLWGAPVLALAVGGAVVAIGLRTRAKTPPPPPSDAERARLERLIGP